MEEKTIDIGNEFCQRLTNRNENFGDGKHTAIDFRNLFLKEYDNPEIWKSSEIKKVTFYFNNVTSIIPSFANEAFAYFRKYADVKTIKKYFKFEGISKVKMDLIELEFMKGYRV